jgi:hypothetical protein
MIHPDLIEKLKAIDIHYVEKPLAINQAQPSFVQFEYISSNPESVVSNERFHVNIKATYEEIVKITFERVQEAAHLEGTIVGRNDIRHKFNKLLEIED